MEACLETAAYSDPVSAMDLCCIHVQSVEKVVGRSLARTSHFMILELREVEQMATGLMLALVPTVSLQASVRTYFRSPCREFRVVNMNGGPPAVDRGQSKRAKNGEDQSGCACCDRCSGSTAVLAPPSSVAPQSAALLGDRASSHLLRLCAFLEQLSAWFCTQAQLFGFLEQLCCVVLCASPPPRCGHASGLVRGPRLENSEASRR